MVSFQLDPQQLERLDDLAIRRGEAAAEIARRIVVDYLEFQNLGIVDDDDWSEAAIALTPEIMGDENWVESANGP